MKYYYLGFTLLKTSFMQFLIGKYEPNDTVSPTAVRICI